MFFSGTECSPCSVDEIVLAACSADYGNHLSSGSGGDDGGGGVVELVVVVVLRLCYETLTL